MTLFYINYFQNHRYLFMLSIIFKNSSDVLTILFTACNCVDKGKMGLIITRMLIKNVQTNIKGDTWLTLNKDRVYHFFFNNI